MNGKHFILHFLVLCFIVGLPGLCIGEDAKAGLIVKNIAFNRVKGGIERITLSCNQSCAPELFSIEEENPRVVMDMKGVLQIQTKSRSVETGGKYVKRVRNYLDNETKILRIVLDMEPSKYFIVRPLQHPSSNTYSLTIRKDDTASHSSQDMRIKLLLPDLRPAREGGKLPKAKSINNKRKVVKNYEELVVQGRSQLNDSEFVAAADTFTQILKTHPRDSLSYRLRGNAYDNLGDRQKAVDDWTQAARLGDTTLESFLDFIEVKWRENPAAVADSSNR